MRLKVFISGITGFVGCHLMDLLSSTEVMIYGTSFPGKPEPSRTKKNIFHLDIRSEKKVSEVIRSTKPDWIFHLAAISNVKYSWKKRREALETNIMGTFNLLDAVRKSAHRARILIVSSSDVYGNLLPPEKALKEEDSFHIVNPYAFTKVSGEILSEFYARIEKLDVVIARPFPHTGPGQSSDFVCSDWAYQIARIEKGLEEPVIRIGNLAVKRDFSDVRDVVKAYVLLMEKGRSGEIYNVCSGKAVSLKKILSLLLSFSTEAIEVQADTSKLRKADIHLLVGDNMKIKQETLWQPKIPIKQSLFDLLEYWRHK